MIDKLVQFSLHNRLLMVVLAVLVMAGGYYS
jgi:Cu/Ag efflux pump CusA